MIITYRVDRRQRGLDNLARMFESLDTGRNGGARIGRRSKVRIEAGIFDTARRSLGTKLFAGKARKILGALTNAAVASLQEYGTSTAPARPFIGPALRLNRRRYLDMIVEAIRIAQKSKRAVPVATWNRIGARMKLDIQDYILKGVPPPNAPSTIAKKGHGHTLMDSEQMIQAVDYRVKGL